MVKTDRQTERLVLSPSLGMPRVNKSHVSQNRKRNNNNNTHEAQNVFCADIFHLCGIPIIPSIRIKFWKMCCCEARNYGQAYQLFTFIG